MSARRHRQVQRIGHESDKPDIRAIAPGGIGAILAL
jgi:hypothetical protein